MTVETAAWGFVVLLGLYLAVRLITSAYYRSKEEHIKRRKSNGKA